MKLTEIDMQGGFRVLAGTDRSQVATMVLSPGQSTGGPDNRHPQSDQWLFVILGHGKAVVEARSAGSRLERRTRSKTVGTVPWRP